MVESTTRYYGWIKPEIQKSPTTWGGFLNDALDAIDGLIYAGQQAIVPIGSVTMFVGVTPPVNWLWCLGQVYQITDIPLLAPLLSNRFPGGDGVNTMAVPNFGGGRSPVAYDGAGWSMGLSGGEITHTLTSNEMAYHNHSVSDPTHAHGVYDPTHAHSVWLGDPGHAHIGNTPNHNHGVHTGGHSHGLDHQVPTTNAGGQVGAQVGGWLFQSINTTGVGDLGGYTDTAGSLQAWTDTRGTGMAVAMNAVGTGIGIYGAGTGISVGYVGGNVAHNNMPPYIVIGFIVRYQ